MARVPHTRRSICGLFAIVGLALGLLSVTINFSTAADARSSAAQLHSAPARQLSLTRSNTLSQILGKLAGTRAFRSLASTQPLPLPTPDPGASPGPGPVDPTTPDPTPTSDPTTPASPTSTPTPSSSPTPTADPTPTSAPTPTPTPSSGPDGSLLWSDEFNGAAGTTANSSVWERINGGRWGNGELECYSDGSDYSSMDGNGHLVLTARYTPGHQCMYGATNDYTSARLSSDGRAITASHGSIRVRAELPVAQGVWPAIWALGDNNDSVGWPNAGEIDMAEAIGESNTMYGNIHFPSSAGPAALGTGYTLSSPMNSSFHIYGVDWSPNSVSLSVDNHVYKTITKSEVTAAGGTWVFDRPFFVLLNIAVGGTWPGNPKDNSAFPQSMTVDYVRVYQ